MQQAKAQSQESFEKKAKRLNLLQNQHDAASLLASAEKKNERLEWLSRNNNCMCGNRPSKIVVLATSKINKCEK